METELSHSFNIRLSQEISEKLKVEQDKLATRFKEQRMYDSSPHLAIATKFMGEEETNVFIQTLKNEFKNDVVWKLEFSDFRLSDTSDYIFLHMSGESKQKLMDLHERVFRVSQNIGLEIQTGKKFRHFDYSPHISIIKILPEEANDALEFVKKDFSGVTMLVSTYEMTRQMNTNNGFSTFPVVGEIELK